jgi:hypothetical protein
MTDGQLLNDLIARLALLRERAGPALYRRAVTAARTAVGRVVLTEAERLAGVCKESGTVVRFPIGRPREPK